MYSLFSERQSLLSPGADEAPPPTFRRRLFDLLEANNKTGMLLEAVTVLLIVINVVCFMLSTEESLADSSTAWLIFDYVELCTVTLFTTEYILRFYSVVEATDSNGQPMYADSLAGRLRWAVTDFYSWVDLASIVPFYVDIMVAQDLPATQFIRLARMLRMMKEGGFGEAFDAFGDIFRKNRKLMTTSVFVGLTTWLMLSSFNHIAERDNPDMVWTYPSCYFAGDEESGGARDGRPDCQNRYGSILSASYFTLLNLFGEFPLMDGHSPAGRFIGAFTAVVAVAVFAIPTGIFGAGFEDMIQHRKQGKQQEQQGQEGRGQEAAGRPDSPLYISSESNGSAAPASEVSAASGAGAGYFTLAPPPGEHGGRKNSADISGHAYGDGGGGGRNGVGGGFLAGLGVGQGGQEDGADEGDGFSFLDTRTRVGKRYRTFLLAVVVLDILAFFASTTFYLQDGDLVGAGVALGALEIFSVAVFTADYAARVMSAAAEDGGRCPCGGGAMRYVVSFYGVVDLFSVLPFFLGLPVCGGLRNLSPALLPTLVRSCRLIRMLKLERYVRAFEVFDDAIRDQLDILAVSGFFALVAWIFASSLLYYTERNGPDPSMTPYYQSVPMAMWVTLLNLSGEAPLCDYTVWGKIITGALGIFGVGVFAVPVGLLGAGFQEYVETIPDEEDALNKPTAVLPIRAGLSSSSINANGDYEDGRRSPGDTRQKPLRKRVHAFLEARTTWGRRFETFIMIVIFVTVTQAIVMTMPSVCADETHCPSVFDQVELLAVVIFTIEYAVRVYASPETYPEKTACMARLRYMVSFYAVIDFLAIFPYYVAQMSARVDEYDNYLRLLRLLRILKLDKYTPCVSLIDDVFRLKARGLLVAGYAAAVMLAWFGSLMYLVERDDNEVQVHCYFESQRFSSVLNSLQYDLILLTGDYPLIDFTLLGRYINFVQIFVAVGVVAVPSALIANGFSQVLEESRNAKHAKRRAAAVLLQRQVRGHLARRQFLLVVEGAQQQEDERKRQKLLMEMDYEAQLPIYQRSMRVCYRFSNGVTAAGKLFDAFVATLILLNVAAVIAESEPSLGGRAGSSEARFQGFFDGFEAFSVLVFTAEISMRLFIAPISSRYSFSRWTYLSSFFGFIDIASIAPWYVETILRSSGVYFDASAFRVLRLFRILQLEHFVSAFSLLDDVWTASKDTLAATGLLALVVWVGSACLFYLFEKDNVCTGDAFSSIPDAMFYTAVFLGGEWAQIDFTWPGKVLCCVLCVFGIVLFGIPVGSVFEAFQDVMQEVHEEEAEEENQTGGGGSVGDTYGILIGAGGA
eukprot:g5248.t1